MPKQGLNLKKPLPVIRKKPCPLYKHEYTKLWNCLKPSTNLYGVLPVRLTSHVHTVKGLTVNATLKLKVIKILTNLEQIKNP